MKYVALYPRVSTQEQAKEGYSIDEQIERLKNFCLAMNWKNFKIYTDAGYSGGNMNRPALQRMISDVKAGKIEKVVVYKLDRLSRSQKDTLNIIEDIFLKNGVDFISMSENFDTSSPFGRAMVGILAVFAQLEREQIKERLTMGREARAKEGKWVGVGNVPVGYNYENGELVVDPFEALQVKELFELYLNGMSPRKIAEVFSNKGYKTKYGKWYEKRIVTTLKNRLYIGEVSFDQKYYKGNHEPIIDSETFEEVQKAFEERKRSVIPSARQSTLLGGLLFCKCCGARYGIYGAGKYKYYACHSRRKRNAAMIKDPNCKNKTYNLTTLNETIKAEVRKLIFDPAYFEEVKTDQNHDEVKNEKADVLKKQIEKLEEQRGRFLDLYGFGTFTAEELQSKVEPLKDQIQQLTEELSELEADRPVMEEEKAVELISSFADVIDSGNDEEIRKVIEALISKIEIDVDDILIHWNF